jgi:hypothetical protein
MNKWPVLCAMVLVHGIACAQSESTELGGYLKYLGSVSGTDTGSTRVDHLLHGRLNGKWYPATSLTAALELRLRVFTGSTVAAIPSFADQIKNRSGVEHADVTLWHTSHSLAYGEVDRLYVNWTSGLTQLTAGRQRIAWGTNLVWNVVDVFNPLSVLDFDYEERPAVDAVQVQYYTGEVTKVAAVYRPHTPSSSSMSGLLLTLNKWEYDFHLLGGTRGDNWYAGLAWAGDILGGGFRGETMVSKVSEESRSVGGASRSLSCALSGDYTFPNSLYLHAEALYNSIGKTSAAGVFAAEANSLGLLSPARWSLYQEVSGDLTPLLRGSVFHILNPSDGSSVTVASLTWSAATNLDLSLFGLTFQGSPLSEFGGEGNVLYGRVKWSF